MQNHKPNEEGTTWKKWNKKGLQRYRGQGMNQGYRNMR